MRTLLLLLAGLLAASCQRPIKAGDLEERDARWQEAIQDLQAYQDRLEVENAQLGAQVEALRVQVERAKAASAREAGARVDRGLQELQDAMQRMAFFASGDLEFADGPYGPVVRIKDRILFPSGSEQVTREGEELLRQLAVELVRLGRPIRVEGHTDNVPVRVQAQKYPLGNLQLSTARALHVAAVLQDAGLPAEEIAVAGYGEWRPLAGNDTPAGRARNRRVEIALGVPAPR